MNLGNLSVPIIDLAILLKYPRQSKYSLTTPILLCGNTEQKVGLIIDEVLDLANVEQSQMEEQFDYASSPFEAVINIDSQLTLLLNMDHLLSMNLVYNPSIEYLEYE